MASRYWVGGSATWDGTAGSKWSTTSGGAGGAAVPTNADDVFFDANSGSVTVTVSGSRACLNLDTSGFTGTIDFGSSVLTIANGGTNGAVYIAPTGTYNFGTSEIISANSLNAFIYDQNIALNKLTAAASTGWYFIVSGAPTTCSIATFTLGINSVFTGESGMTISVTNFVATGTAGNLIFILADAPGSEFSFSVASGDVVCDYLDLTDCHGIGGATFYAGSHSVNNGNNTGWSFTDPVTGTITPPTGTLTTAGQTPVSKQAYGIPAGALVLTSNAPSVVNAQILAAPLGALVMAGFAPVELNSFTIPAGAMTITGLVPAIAQGKLVDLGILSITGIAPNFAYAVEVPLGSLVALAYAPDSTNAYIIAVPVGSVLMTTYEEVEIDNPEYTYREKQPKTSIVPSDFFVQGIAPGYGIGSGQDFGALVLTGNAPNRLEKYLSPLGALTLTGNIPTYTNA